MIWLGRGGSDRTREMFEEKYLKVQGIKIRYFDQGKGPAVLLIHGLGGAAVNWFENIDSLSQKYRVVVPDLPSFGKSEVPKVSSGEIGYDYFTSFLKNFLEKLRIKKIIPVGGSMGGGIAVNFALKFPQRVEKLVIVSGSGLGQEISLYKMLRQPLVQRVLAQVLSNKAVMRQVARLVLYNPCSLDEASVVAYINWLKNPEVQKLITQLGSRAVDSTGQKWLFIDRLSEIYCPTLVIWGRNDRVLPLKQGLRAHESIRGSKLVVFNQCGHVPFLEKPGEFNQALLEFLAGGDRVEKE